ncbi:hypothetical protein AA309_20835 [Microvirga vignae]|uniref:Uncharacterized protein n=1 Tax=Microvirga vignae TaxID=1225564 RepID=A0A0H1R840_9HYPH|nr:hypothetical protein AA309_20835 [Microvirga vignae]
MTGGRGIFKNGAKGLVLLVGPMRMMSISREFPFLTIISNALTGPINSQQNFFRIVCHPTDSTGLAEYVRHTDLVICPYGSNLPAPLRQRALSFCLDL